MKGVNTLSDFSFKSHEIRIFYVQAYFKSRCYTRVWGFSLESLFEMFF